MRKLIVQQWVTADGVAAEPGGGLSFVAGEPFSDTDTSPFKTEMMGFIDSVDTMVLGANTYRQTHEYWPNATDQGEYGEKLNRLEKIVASSTLDDAPWGDFAPGTVTKDPVGTINDLKARDGKNLWLWGSLQLMTSLFNAGTIDEVRMLVCSATRGEGLRLFTDRQDLELLEATAFDHEVALLRYAVQNPVHPSALR